ncbi:MAG: ABC transporter permease [Clostridiales Family XIII bacterium]|nr:ABC transporter permease [Clostridiales Family XIII bacterium]
MDDTRRRSQMLSIWKRLCRNKLSIIGMIIFLILVLAAIFAKQIAPYDYSAQDLTNALAMPSAEHWMGTDDFGRDILSRVIYGGRISLLVALLGIIISLVAGGLIGVISGYYSGTLDGILMRIMDVIMAIPGFLLAVCVSAALGSGVLNTAIAIAIAGIPGYARLMRALVMSIRGNEYVEAARVCGQSGFRIMIREIVPNTLSPIIVDTTLRIGAYILMISSLSFIGLGVQPPEAEWGSMLSAGRQYIRSFWPIVTFPGLAIMATLFGLNLFGDGLRDALDPRLKK